MDNKEKNPSPENAGSAESGNNSGAENGNNGTEATPNSPNSSNSHNGNAELPDIKNILDFNSDSGDNIKKDDSPGDIGQNDNGESSANSDARDDSPKGPEESNPDTDDFASSQMPMQYWREDSAGDGKQEKDPEDSTAGNSAQQSANDTKPFSAQGSQDDEAEDDESSMGLLDHLNELRRRLVKACIAVAVCFGICWAFVDPLFDILVNPLMAVLPEGTHAQYTTLPEAFFTRMYIAFVASIFLASPVIFYQIWAFVAPGLYDEEKRYIIPIAFLSAVFFICGAFFCYYIVFPFAFNFFISYSTPEIVITPKVSDYLSFVIKLLFAFGLIFEMPIFTLFLARLGIVTAAMMRKARRYAIVAIFILAAILTPPDVVSQLLMACPMLLLYELSIGVAVVFGRKNRKNGKNNPISEADQASPDTSNSSGKT